MSIYYGIREMGDDCTVVIDSEDTDVYVQAAYASHIIDGNLCIRRKSLM